MDSILTNPKETAMARLLTALTLASLVTTTPAAAGPIAYPEGYRAWAHVKSMVILPGHPLADPFAGIHHLYANPAALEGYRTRTFPDGAVIVFDLLEATGDSTAFTEGRRKLVGVMVRDTRGYAATGGWGFEGFAGDSHSERLVDGKGATACYPCHETTDNSHVFSRLRP